MAQQEYMIIEMIFVIVGALGLGLWQLRSVSREIARDKAAKESPEGSGHPIGEHRLDDR